MLIFKCVRRFSSLFNLSFRFSFPLISHFNEIFQQSNPHPTQFRHPKYYWIRAYRIRANLLKKRGLRT